MTTVRIQQPHDIAKRIVDWFPHGSFTFDTYAKLQLLIAQAIYNERSPSQNQGATE